MAFIDFEHAEFFSRGDAVAYPIRGTACVMTKNGAVRSVIPRAVEDEASPENKARLDAARSVYGLVRRAGSFAKAWREMHDTFFDLYDPPEMSLFPDALNSTFDYSTDEYSICERSVRGKWQRAVYARLEDVVANNTLVFRRYVFDTRVTRGALVDLVLSNLVFCDTLVPCDAETLEHPIIDLRGTETWQARKNINRAIDALLADSVLVAEQDKTLRFNVIKIALPRKEAIQREIDKARLDFCFFPQVVDLSAWA